MPSGGLIDRSRSLHSSSQWDHRGTVIGKLIESSLAVVNGFCRCIISAALSRVQASLLCVHWHEISAREMTMHATRPTRFQTIRPKPHNGPNACKKTTNPNTTDKMTMHANTFHAFPNVMTDGYRWCKRKKKGKHPSGCQWIGYR